MQRFQKGQHWRTCFFFKVVFEKELDLTNVPETLKDELKQVQSVEVDEFLMKLKWGRFWWTESPPKSAQKSTRESRPTQKKALESKCTLLSAQKSALIFRLAPKRAQEIAQKSKTLKKALKRVGFSRKCSGEWVIQKWGALKRVCYS